MTDYLRQKIFSYRLPYRAHRSRAVLRACQEACGPRTVDKATHTHPACLRPWEGPVAITLRIWSTTTGRVSSIGRGSQ